MEVEFVGKNGQRRKLEVRPMQDPEVVAHKLMNIFFSLADDHGSSEAQEVVPVRGEMARYVQQTIFKKFHGGRIFTDAVGR